MIVKSLEQFLCDYFKDDDLVEIEAKFLQSKLMELIKNERLAKSQASAYKDKYEMVKYKLDTITAKMLLQDIYSNVKYRIIDERA